MQTLRSITYTKQSPKSALTLLTGHGSGQTEAINALIRAERNGSTRSGNCVLCFDGYQAGTDHFHAENALYRVTF